MIETALVVFAFLVGVGTFFSPCAVGLLPGYVGYFTGLGVDRAGQSGSRGLAGALAAGVRFGLAAAAGILVVFALFAALVYLLRTTIHLPSHVLARVFETGGIAVGVFVILLGVIMLVGKAPSWTPRFAAPKGRNVGSMMLFGALYAFASLGCTLPLFFAVLVQAILAGPLAGSVLIVAFALGFAGLMFAFTLLLSVAEAPARRFLRAAMPYVKPVSGVLLVLAGGFIVYYYLVLTQA